ncbi:MAG: endonuclease [Muribaculaceae bacterium]|nr:endonuclease [Muribaculaceae bacterium]
MAITHRIKTACLYLVFAALGLNADEPSGYYSTCENLGGENLLKALYSKISSHTNVGYDGLWSLYKTSDVKPNGKIWDMYSTKEWPTNSQQCGQYKIVGDCYNREHSFPKSWFSKGSPMVSDAFHIYPTDGKVNGQRSNYPYGECANGTTLPSNGSVKALGRLGSSTFSGYNGTVFEPVDEYKGDFARSYFYMAACYYNKIGNWNSPMLAGNNYPAFTSWAINLLLKWHRQDPVSKKETDRNDAVYARQHNRNPFIDHPEMAEYIWGNKKNERWSSDTNKEPEINSPASGSTIDLGITSAGDYQLIRTITVKGSHLTQNVSVSSSDSHFTVTPTSLAASSVNSDAGAKVSVMFKNSVAAKSASTLTFRSGTAVSTVNVKAETVEGLPALPATDITTEGFTARWVCIGDEFDGGTYKLTVYKGPDVVAQYDVNAKAETYEVGNLEPTTAYSYTLSSRNQTSNAVDVTTATPMPAVNFYYDGDLSFSAVPGEASEAAELLVEIENIDTDVEIEVNEPFELSTDKSNWSTKITLNVDEDRCYLRVNSAKAGVFETSITATAGEYVNDDATVQAIVCELTNFIEDFEALITTSGYEGGEWVGTAATWYLDDVGMYATDKSEAHNGKQCVRYGKSTTSSIEMLTDTPNGAGTVELYGKRWSSSDGDATVELLYSTDQGKSWTSVGTATFNSDSYNKYTFTVNRQGNIRLKFAQTKGKRCFIDDIAVSNYTASSSIDPVENYHAWDAYCRDGQLIVEASSKTKAAIYGVDGITYHNGTVASGETSFNLPAGLYIVSIGDFTRRVLIK